METLYLLIRTSRRPEGFKVLMDSIKKLEYPKIVTIVHTDDPRDNYAEGDILIRGEAYPIGMGTAPYNLYNNRLMSAIKKDGWVHFMDDDDAYVAPNVFNFLETANKENMQVAKVIRWNGQIFPKNWKKQKSFQTECFVIWSGIAKKYKWWSEKGGDHYFTRQITRTVDIKWHDHVIAEAQNGKGHGKRIDINNEPVKTELPQDTKVWVKISKSARAKMKGLQELTLMEGELMEKLGVGRITFKGVDIYDSFNKEERVC
jgi:hypothetical protein